MKYTLALILMVIGLVGCSQENTILKLSCVDAEYSTPVSIDINRATMEWSWVYVSEMSGKISKVNDQYYVFGVWAGEKWRDFYYINRSTLKLYMIPSHAHSEEEDIFEVSLEKLPSYESASIEQDTYWASCEIATQKI